LSRATILFDWGNFSHPWLCSLFIFFSWTFWIVLYDGSSLITDLCRWATPISRFAIVLCSQMAFGHSRGFVFNNAWIHLFKIFIHRTNNLRMGTCTNFNVFEWSFIKINVFWRFYSIQNIRLNTSFRSLWMILLYWRPSWSSISFLQKWAIFFFIRYDSVVLTCWCFRFHLSSDFNLVVNFK